MRTIRASRTGNRNRVRSRPSGQTIVEARIYCDMDLLEVIAMMTAKLIADAVSASWLIAARRFVSLGEDAVRYCDAPFGHATISPQ